MDHTATDFAEPFDQITGIAAAGVTGRYLRLTATHLRPAEDGVGYKLALAKVEVVSAGKDVAENCPVTGDQEFGNPRDLGQITRPVRPMGEGIVTDNPGNVIAAQQWHSVPFSASAPLGGVRLKAGDGLFWQAMENNIAYLLSSFSIEEMVRPFRERAGKPVRAGDAPADSLLGDDPARLQRRPVFDGRGQYPALDRPPRAARLDECSRGRDRGVPRSPTGTSWPIPRS